MFLCHQILVHPHITILTREFPLLESLNPLRGVAVSILTLDPLLTGLTDRLLT